MPLRVTRNGQNINTRTGIPQPDNDPRAQMIQANQVRDEGASTYINPAARLAELSNQWAMNPGRAPGGSGSTGLLSNDAAGWRQMLADQREYAALQDIQRGGTGQQTTRYAGSAADPYSVGQASLGSGFSPATGQNNAAAFGLPADVGGAAVQGIYDAVKKAKGTPADANRYLAGNRYGRTV